MLTVSNLLETKKNELFTIGKARPVLECVQVMNQHRIGSLMVISEQNQIEGIITERDILHAVSERNGSILNITVQDIMTGKENLVTASQNDTIDLVMELMTARRIRHIPVLEDGKLIGVVSIGDVVKNQLRHALLENESMKTYISGTSS